MNIDLEYKSALNDIIQDVLRSEKIIDSEQEAIMKKAGQIIKKKVADNLPLSDIDHEHMKKDIKVTLSGKKKKTGITGVTVHGGKWTGYKWHMLDSGTRNPNGTVHTPATHFVSKSLKEAEPEIETMINELQRRIVEA